MSPSERVPTVTRYLVAGVLGFPVDMLRYDACWPDGEADSHLIEASVRYETTGRVRIVVCSRRPLTVGRWESFGWQVVEVMS